MVVALILLALLRQALLLLDLVKSSRGERRGNLFDRIARAVTCTVNYRRALYARVRSGEWTPRLLGKELAVGRQRVRPFGGDAERIRVPHLWAPDSPTVDNDERCAVVEATGEIALHAQARLAGRWKEIGAFGLRRPMNSATIEATSAPTFEGGFPGPKPRFVRAWKPTRSLVTTSCPI